MIIFHYTDNSTPISDFQVEKYLDKLFADNKQFLNNDGIENKDLTINFSNSLINFAVRYRVKRGEINRNHVAFLMNNVIMYVDNNGKQTEWPEGFCDMWDNYLDKLIE